jgi:hypothetical protein
MLNRVDPKLVPEQEYQQDETRGEVQNEKQILVWIGVTVVEIA